MNKTKPEEITSEAFGDDFWRQQFEEPIRDDLFPSQVNEAGILEFEDVSAESNGDKWIKILKGLFLFLPGVLFLFATSIFTFYRFFTLDIGILRLSIVLPWLLLWGFAVMFGIGKIKNPKHLYLPLSIVGTAFLTFLVSVFLSDEAGWVFLANYSIYLLPLVYVIPILVRDLIDGDSI